MAKVVIYTNGSCAYCFRAKSVLDAREIAYEEIDLEESPERAEEMIRLSGGRQGVPQVFIGGKHIGGAQELGQLHSSGELDKLLATPD